MADCLMPLRTKVIEIIDCSTSFYSQRDYEMGQLADAQKLAFDQLGDGQARKFRSL